MLQQSIKAEFKTEAFYQAYQPHPDLQSLIHEYWIMHLNKEAPHQKGELELPRLYPEIIFKFGEDYEEFILSQNKKLIRDSSTISGVSTYAKASKRVNVSQSLILIGIKFKPLGLYELLQIPVYELMDQCIGLSDYSHPALLYLEEKLFSAGNRKDIVRILNKEFLECYRTINLSIPQKNLALNIEKTDLESLGLLIKNHKGNYKSLERYFKKFIGTSPKKYFKLRRFNSFYQDWLKHDSYRYIDLVYKYNYFDQNHLIKEFKSVMNMAPGKFLKTSHTTFTQHITKSHL